MTSESGVTLEVDGPVAWVRLRNPPRNLLTPAMIEAFDAVTLQLEADAGVRVVVVTGDSQDAFITHFDVEVLLGSPDAAVLSPARAAAALRAAEADFMHDDGDLPLAAAAGLLALHAPLDRIGRMDKVWIAAINGLALGGGFELALACDLRLMADRDDCRIGLPEALFGISPGMGGAQRVTRAVGTSRAIALMLEGELLTAGEALAIGLVHRVVSADGLLAEAGRTAERLARRSPRTVSAIKQSVYHGASLNLGDGLHVDRAGAMATVDSPEGRSGMAELTRRHPSAEPLTSEAYIAALAAWQRGEVLDFGRPGR